jgi:hypothetical protein
MVAIVATALMGLPATVAATPVAVQLSGQNGDGTFNDRLDCAESGAGDTWRYDWQDGLAGDAGGALAGRWNGGFEIHRGLAAGSAFVPAGDGHLALTITPSGGRAGSAFFDTTGSGSCAVAGLTLAQIEPDDPTAQRASGSLPIVATDGLGALRGLTGSGAIGVTLDLTPGADNVASVAMTGSFGVLHPAISATSGSARWDNLSAFLQHKLRVSVNLANPAAAGDAFAVSIASASGATGSFEGLPAGPATLLHGATATLSFVMRNAQPGHAYTIGVSVAHQDGLLAARPPATGSVKVTAPSLP